MLEPGEEGAEEEEAEEAPEEEESEEPGSRPGPDKVGVSDPDWVRISDREEFRPANTC